MLKRAEHYKAYEGNPKGLANRIGMDIKRLG